MPLSSSSMCLRDHVLMNWEMLCTKCPQTQIQVQGPPCSPPRPAVPHAELCTWALLPHSHCLLSDLGYYSSSLLSRSQTWQDRTARWDGAHPLPPCWSHRALPRWAVQHMGSPYSKTSISSRSPRVGQPSRGCLKAGFYPGCLVTYILFLPEKWVWNYITGHTWIMLNDLHQECLKWKACSSSISTVFP